MDRFFFKRAYLNGYSTTWKKKDGEGMVSEGIYVIR